MIADKKRSGVDLKARLGSFGYRFLLYLDISLEVWSELYPMIIYSVNHEFCR